MGIGQRELPSTLVSYFTILACIFSSIGTFWWFAATSIDIIKNLMFLPVNIEFYKTGFYMLGCSVGLGVLTVVAIIEFGLHKTISASLNKTLTRVGVASLIVMILLPQIVHYPIEYYLENKGYFVCKQASHQWLHSRKIIYVKSDAVCVELSALKR